MKEALEAASRRAALAIGGNDSDGDICKDVDLPCVDEHIIVGCMWKSS